MGLSSPTYQIGDWKAGDTGIQDANGTTWGVSRGGTTGIFDGPDVRINQTPFPNADGAQRSRSFRIPRVMTLMGWAKGTSVAGTEKSRRAFVGMFARGGQDTLTVTFLDGLAATALVERAGIPRAAPANPFEFDWQLVLSAVDPSLYGPQSSSSTGLPSSSGGLDWTGGGNGGLDWSTDGGLDWGTVTSAGLITLTNAAFADAWPTFTIKGPVTDPTVINTGTGQRLVFTDTLTADDTVTLTSNPINRSVLKNNQPFRVNLTVAQWFPVAGGESIKVQFQGSSEGTPTLTASLSDAY